MQIIEDFLTPNSYSRPQKSLNKVKGVVIHYVANPGSHAEGNRNFFENRKFGKTNYGSAHYIVEGMKVIQCLPDNELAYGVGSPTYTTSALRNLSSYPNNVTLHIEMTHNDSTGKPDDVTYQTTIKLTAKLLKENGLTEKDVWTHQQVVGWKQCHLYYVKNPKEWVRFISDVATELRGETVTIPTPQATKANDYVLVKALGHGDKGSKVKTLQENLNKLGYDCGNADGIFGDKTDKALEKFQKDNGLVADGLVGDKTQTEIEKALEKLKAKKPNVIKAAAKTNELSYTRVLENGMSGNDVKELQVALNSLGHNCGNPDGKFGDNTEEAVKNFQKYKGKGLKVDGIAGKLTINEINNQLNK